MENWDDLKVFLIVARTGGLTPAAKLLKMDAATVGRRITRLEAARGVVLFQRSPQGYVLTPAGQALQSFVDAAEASLNAGLGALAQSTDQLEGQVRIGAPDGCANYVLPQICADIGKDHPDLDLQIVALPRVVNLSGREADMAIGVSAPTAGRLIVQRICDYHLHLAAIPDVGRRLTTLDDLKSERIVGYIPDMIFDRELDYLGELNLTRVHAASNSIAVQMQLLQAGAGVGVVHQFAMPHAPGLIPVLPEIRFKRSFYLIRAKEDQKDERLNKIAEILRRAVIAQIAKAEASLGTPGESR